MTNFKTKQRKKIILIRHNLSDARVPPFGLMLLADSLFSIGFLVKIYDEKPSPELEEIILSDISECLFVGFSTFTCSSLLSDISFSIKLKQYGVTIVWGGPHATLNPKETIIEPFVDYVLMGESEKQIQKLALQLSYNGKCEDMPGLAWKDGSGVKINENWEPLVQINDYRFRWELIDISNYFRRMGKLNKVLTYITSRGCPYRCGFCYNSLNSFKKVRFYDEERIITEINYIKEQYNIDGILFNDDCLFYNEQRAFRIIDKIGLPWIGEIRADQCTKDFLSKAKKTNCFQIFIGGESGDDNMLKAINKDISTKDIIKAASNIQKMGIKMRFSFIIFFPNETIEQMLKTTKLVYLLIKRYGAEIPRLKTFNAYRGTKLYNICVSMGWKAPNRTLEWAKYARDMDCVPYPFFDEKTIKMGQKLLIAVKGISFFYGIRIHDHNDTMRAMTQKILLFILRIILTPFLFIGDQLWLTDKISLPFEYYFHACITNRFRKQFARLLRI